MRLELEKLKLVTPRSRRYGDITVMYIHMVKIPSHIYAKHHTGRNQITKVCGALNIPTNEYIYKVITGCDTIL